MKLYQSYIDSVTSGTRNAGLLERQAVQRFIDLQKQDDIYFDEGEVEHVTRIIGLLRHTSGHYYKRPFQLLPWQSFVIAHIFGLKYKATGKRVTRKAYIEISKKNGKSEFAGALGLYGAFFDEEAGAECYSAANKYDQAAICWGAGKVMAQLLRAENKQFERACKIYDSINSRFIKNMVNESFFKPLAADSKTLDGLRPHFAIIDEFHEAVDDSVLKNLETAMVSRLQPLLMIITTAGFNINGACYQYRKVVADILATRTHDDSVFGLIFSPNEDDDWNDPAAWEKANPSLGQTPTLEGLQTMYRNAVNEGATSEINFKTKNLNIWVRQSKTWISDAIWMAGQEPFADSDLPSLAGRRCFGALDLSSNRDLTAFGLLFPPEDGDDKFRFICRYYIPEDNAIERAKRDRVPYLDWAKRGLVNFTEGNVTDYDLIKEDVLKAASLYNIETISYDRWQSLQLAIQLQDAGITMDMYAQTVTKFNEPIRMIENLISLQQLQHGGDEVLRWMAGNITLRHNKGLVMFDKDKSREKIDGLVVMAMCFGGYIEWLRKNEDSVYNSTELRVI